jgi:hypothetical protein
MNVALVQHYMSLAPISVEYQNYLCNKLVKSDMIINLLNDLNINWAYEIEREDYLEDGTAYHVVITLYLPGFIRTGVGMANTDFGREHKFSAIQKAILNACSTFARRVGGKTNSQDVKSDTGLNDSSKNQVDKVQEMTSQDSKPASQSQQPPANNHGFTDEQIQGMKDFKAQYEVETDDQFARYLTMWNPNVTSKRQLTPQNIDSFLDWVKNLAGNVI